MKSIPPPKLASQRGLQRNAIGLVDSIVLGVASTGPAYSIAATIGFVVVLAGVSAPAAVWVAFIPIALAAVGYNALNRREPDCGTSFMWVSRAFGPYIGWMAGWAIIVADVLVMASLAQVASQYTFLVVGADSIGSRSDHPAVFLGGCAFIVVLTWMCVRGTALSARFQRILVITETLVLIVFALIALWRVYDAHAAGSPIEGSMLVQWSWFNPFEFSSFSTFVEASLLMVFIYWGWDSVLSVNEETRSPAITPGKAAVISTVILVAVYVLSTVAVQAYAGVGDTGIGLANPDHMDDVMKSVGEAVFGPGLFGQIAVSLLLVMVLTSAAASTQTTLLPTARTTLSMGFHGALPARFATVHDRFLTPSFSTWMMGAISIALYAALNFVSEGLLIFDAVAACGVAIGFYYGFTALASAKLFASQFTSLPAKARATHVVLPAMGGLLLVGAALWTSVASWDPEYGETPLTIPFTEIQLGSVFVFGVGGMALGLVLMLWQRAVSPAFFNSPPARALPHPQEVAQQVRET